MILEDENWSLGYDTLLEESRPGNGRDEQRSILILCNADVDAMASARILTYLLRSDAIPYQLLPCTSYSDLQETLRSLNEQMEQFSAIVLLNFGASYNLTKLFLPTINNNNNSNENNTHQHQPPLVPETLKIFVLDCRRPVHLANVYEESAVVVFMNEAKETIDEFPSDGDDLSGIDEDEEDDDDDDDEQVSDSSSGDSADEEEEGQDSDGDSDDDEEEHQVSFDDVEGTAPERKKRTNKGDDSDTDDTDYDGEDEQDQDEEDKDHHDDDDDDDEEDKDKDESTSEQRSPKRQKTGESPDPSGSGADADKRPASPDSSSSPPPPQLDDSSSPAVAVAVAPSQPLSQRELRKDRAQRLLRYYDQGSYFAAPASFMAYRMAEQLRQGQEGDLLWLACVGVTDAYLHARVDRYGFGECGHVLKQACRKLFPDTRVDRVLNSFDAEHLNGSSSSGRNGNTGPKTKIKFSDNGRILAQEDYRFFLMRHSSLLDSLLYSEYVYSKLQMNTKHGQQRFMEMLAKMGLPLDECRQPYRFMKTSLRSRLKSEFETHADDYNLDLNGLTFTSFNRVTGYSSLLSASDTSYAITALLEYETGDSRKDGNGDENKAASYSSSKAVSIEAFNNAYEALGTQAGPTSGLLNGLNNEGYDASNLVNGGNLSSNIGLGAGLRRAMALQKTIITTAAGLMERGAIALLRHFRYAHVTSSTIGGDLNRADLIQSSRNNAGNDKGDHIFSKPLALTRLAHFLMDMNRENGKWTGPKARPLILIADKPSTGKCLVVGYEYPERAGTLRNNRFGKHFERTASAIEGLNYQFDSFESNVIELNAGDVQRFMESLHVLLDGVARGD